MPLRILFPDLIFAGELDLEREVAGPEVEFDVHRAQRIEDVPPSHWAAADAIVVYHLMALDARAAALASRCRIVVRAGVGYDCVDLQAWGERGIPVCNTPDYGTTEVADSAIAYLLAFARGIAAYDELLRADPHKHWDYKLAPAVLRPRSAWRSRFTIPICPTAPSCLSIFAAAPACRNCWEAAMPSASTRR